MLPTTTSLAMCCFAGRCRLPIVQKQGGVAVLVPLADPIPTSRAATSPGIVARRWNQLQSMYGADPVNTMPEHDGSPWQVDDLAGFMQHRKRVQIARRARIARRCARVLVARLPTCPADPPTR